MTEIEQGSINVYEDLGYDDAERMQVKAALAAKIDCLNHLGRDVEIVVRKSAHTRRPGQTRVVDV